MRSWVKDVISVGASKALLILTGLGSAIVVARALGPEKNGIIESIRVYPSLIMSFGSLGISRSVTYLIGKGDYHENEVKSSVVQVWLFTSLIGTISAFLIISLTNPFGMESMLALLASVQIPFVLFNQYVSGIFLGKNEIGSFNKVQWIPGLLIFILILVLILGIKLSVEGYFIAFALGPFAFSIYLFLRYRFQKYLSLRVNWKLLKSLLSLGSIYALALFVIGLNYKADIVLMTRLSNSTELGIYSKGVLLAEYLWQIPMLFGSLVIARSVTAKDGKLFSVKVSQLLRLSLIAIAIASVVMMIFSKTLIVLLYGIEYEASAQVLRLLLPGVLILTVFKVLNMDLAGKGKPWIAIYSMLPAVLLNIILNFFLIPKYGAEGASFASTLSYVLSALLFTYFYCRVTGLRVVEIFKFSKNDFAPILKLLRI